MKSTVIPLIVIAAAIVISFTSIGFFGVALAGIGMLLGAPLAYLTHWAVMDALDLFDVDLGGNIALTATSVLVGVAVLASFLPARAATKVQPTRLLSVE